MWLVIEPCQSLLRTNHRLSGWREVGSDQEPAQRAGGGRRRTGRPLRADQHAAGRPVAGSAGAGGRAPRSPAGAGGGGAGGAGADPAVRSGPTSMLQDDPLLALLAREVERREARRRQAATERRNLAGAARPFLGLGGAGRKGGRDAAGA